MNEKKAWVIVEGTGDYSERVERPVKVFLCLEKAAEEMNALENIYTKYSDARKGFYSPQSKEARKCARKEYELLGYGHTDGTEDWKLKEAILSD